MVLKQTLFTILYLFMNFALFSQTKVQALFEEQKYEKCIQLCDKNINENIDKLASYLYKSLSLTEACDDKDVLKEYPEPIYEALKQIKKLELFKEKHPEDKFYAGNERKIKIVIEKSVSEADRLHNKGDEKSALKIFKKLFDIYPYDDLYVFKAAKTLDFETSRIISQLSEMTDKELYKKVYEVVSNSDKYLHKEGKPELEQALEKLIFKDNCDLEMTSMLLVFLKENYASSEKAGELSQKFCEKYWQMDMLIQVNNMRSSGYTCGNEDMKKCPPLVLDNCLCRTAQKYAELMNKEHHFSHTSPDGKSPWKRAGEEGCYADGENIAMGSSLVSGALEQWMYSSGHCKNIMGYHARMGIGEDGTYWVQMFK